MNSRFLKQIILLVACASVVSISLSIVLFATSSTKTEVIFLDVGQGDSVLIKTKYGQNILIDGGRDNRVLDKLGRNLSFFDRKLDLVIATHPDSDHIAGLVSVLDRYEVGLILESGVTHDSSVYKAYIDIIRSKQIPVKVVTKRQIYELGDGMVFDVMFPTESFINKDIDDNNSASIIIKFSDKEIDYIFTGDAPSSVEEEIVELYGEYLDSEILKIGHHGSDTSSSSLFLDTITPEVVVIQVGKNNPYNHPSFRVLSRLKNLNIPILRNDEMGDIRLVSDGEFVELR